MLRIILIAIVFLFSATSIYAQIDWVEHQIATNYRGCWGTHSMDMDGDGDIDIASAARYDGILSWWENNGFQGFTQHLVDGNLPNVHEVHADDIDNDGDIDLLGVTALGNAVYLYDNDGNMNFTQHTIVQNYDLPGYAYSYDVDSDGDKDIITCAIFGQYLTWWENVGYPNFTRHDIDNTFDGCRHVDAYDLDDDGDTDIIGSAEAIIAPLGEISWYENDGNQVFQQHYVESGYDAYWAKAYDFDFDGDMDILGCASLGHDISWWENDGNMNFTRHIIDGNVGGPQAVEAADFDLDGDLDIVSSLRYEDAICWWENDNNINFTKYIIQGGYDYASTIFPIDIDQDGDIDVVGGAFLGHKLAWWENFEIFIPGIITGTVSDEDMIPLEGVFVQALGTNESDYTNVNGQYELGVSSGTYDVTFQKSGYHEYTAHDIGVISGDTVALDVTLYAFMVPCSSCVRGIVVNRESIEIESAYVWIAGTGFNDYTDFIGRYSLEGLPGSTYEISLSHPFYLDTSVTGVVVVPDSATTLNVMLEGNGAITGVVVDTFLQPIANVTVHVEDLDIYSQTNGLGEYFINGIIPENPYDILFTHGSYIDEMLEDVIVGVNDTMVLDTVVMEPLFYDVVVWYGNLDISPVMAPIGDTILVDVFARSIPDVGFIHLALGTDDQYIVGRHSVNEGVLHYPLTAWDDVHFLQPDILSSGWHSQSLLGFYDIGGGPNPPLQCQDPIRIASYAFEIANDSSLIGDTVVCFMEGYNPANGDPLFGDVNGVYAYYPYQFFSPLYFVEPNPAEVNVWYGNPDSSVISTAIGETVFVDVYVQSTELLNLSSLHLPLATDDRYIAEHLSDTTGLLYYPLTDWDNASFLPVNDLSPGAHSQSLYGIADTGGASNPYLQCLEPTRIASFALKIALDSSIVGETANCLMAGSHPVYGAPLFGDSTGIYSYYPNQFFSSLYIEAPPPPEIFVWYGNPDSSIITAPIGDTILIDVYVQSTGFLNFNSLHLALGADDQYVVDYQSDTAGVLYYPISEWDDIQFLPPNVLSPGWHSQSLFGVADTGGGPNPHLQCPDPVRIASFAMEIVNDVSIIGDTVECLTAGLHPVYGGSFMGDSAGTGPYYPQQFFSSFYFIDSSAGGCEYVVGDANNSGDFNGLDITFGVNYFKGGPAPPYECECTPGDIWFVAGDANGSCSYNGVDITYGVAYFKGGPDPIPCPDCPPVGVAVMKQAIKGTGRY